MPPADSQIGRIPRRPASQSSPPGCQAVTTGIRAAAKEACLPIDPDRLRGPERIRGAHDMMAKRRKPRHDSCRHGALDLEGIAKEENPRRVDRCLNSHPVVDDIGHYLDLTEGLKLTAGHAKRHHRFSL